MKKLKTLLYAIYDQPFQKIQTLRGIYQFPQFEFQFIRIQGSPGANPASIAMVKVAISACGLPKEYLTSSTNKLAVADFLIRRFKQAISIYAQQNRGRDGSGSFDTIELSQKMLERDCISYSEHAIALRFIFSLPAKDSGGGLFDAEQTWFMFEHELCPIVKYVLYYKEYDETAKKLLDEYINIQNYRQQIKDYMTQNGLCVFINNGARLPRQSGVDDQPALGVEIKKFQSPISCQIEIPFSENDSISGMAIKEGITCITGGGYHGKSTLLQAILAGVYAHIPGDGREYIVTREDAVFIRAEEGRSIRHVDISPFIDNLPNGLNTADFCSDNASGSTSQAASIIEATESGSQFLLFDEDTCATNFMFRDELIKKVLNDENEPIKALYSTIRSIWEKHHVSMILVVGGLGSFLQKADSCLMMDNYQCIDISNKVREKLGNIVKEDDKSICFSAERLLSADNFEPSYYNQRLKKNVAKRIKPLRNAPRQLEYGMDLINLEALPQIAEAPQILTVGYCLLKLKQEMEVHKHEAQSIECWLQWLEQKLDQYGLDFLQAEYPGTLSRPRKYEVAAAINRIRSLNLERS